MTYIIQFFIILLFFLVVIGETNRAGLIALVTAALLMIFKAWRRVARWWEL